MSPTQVIVLVLVVLALVAVAAVVVVASRRRALKQRFGPEYDRVIAERDSRSAAERELRDRERRHAELTLTPLAPESRARYAAAWEELQVRFVDSPKDTVGDAHELVSRLITERGYPTGDFSDQVAHLSVEHNRTLGHYRDAHEIHQRNERGEASTEELRQAVVHYRALFTDLLGTEPTSAGHPTRHTGADTGQTDHPTGQTGATDEPARTTGADDRTRTPQQRQQEQENPHDVPSR
ncbi:MULTISPECIES: hypothetical protein [Micromonospora]|uniref:Secreted protein n=1 Tax=Micromonospora yangpuensis TaxID=683228 RepID=A0A1C6V700_9ACTN|nr:hypothetical protein [Micromonospora yangpuensis]GGM19201.1 hypothetical protein GCM10012279_41910 [Micromonospora yangpuensis]SCL61917.1 hypothetical protein GA0070617_4798 [Micromonospora yangpuensis]